jgi:hypothetical protein
LYGPATWGETPTRQEVGRLRPWSFSGSDILGCGYSGAITIIDSRYNAYRMNLNVSNCGAANGGYEG